MSFSPAPSSSEAWTRLSTPGDSRACICRYRMAWVGLALLVLGPIRELRAADGIREPAVAGSFYPASADDLRSEVRSFLDRAPQVVQDAPVALIAPHAGYVYSGQVAADAFRQAQGHDYDLVVVLGTNHTVPPFEHASVYVGDGYRTPLGIIPIDRRLAESLVAESDDFTFDASAHRREHSIEVQLPFVQVLFPKAEILPMIIGSPDPDLCRRIAGRLVSSLAERSVLFVASSDLSHYPPYDVARQVDQTLLEKIVSLDPSAFRKEALREVGRRPGLVTRACGEAPILVAMEVARKLGVERGTLIKYANSGDAPTGDRSRVVGYGAVAMVADRGDPGGVGSTGHESEAASNPLTEAQKHYLLEVARNSIRRYLQTQSAPVPEDPNGTLSFPSGVFVTLREHGHLRGCIGRLEAESPLLEAVVRNALYAAFGDPRFQPVQASEVGDLDIEISILTPLQLVDDVAQIELGRDGVVLAKNGRSATFLPQVAIEQHWNREQMLDRLCVKAGLPDRCWKEGAKFETYRAVVFGESEQNSDRQP